MYRPITDLTLARTALLTVFQINASHETLQKKWQELRRQFA